MTKIIIPCEEAHNMLATKDSMEKLQFDGTRVKLGHSDCCMV